VATYVDHAVSGRQEGRPQLQALMRAARQHASLNLSPFVEG
jgi:hypothetical protein